MFKAKLIQDDGYYRLRRQQLLITLLPAFPLALIISYFEVSIWIIAAAGCCYLALTWWIFKNAKDLRAAIGEQSIEMDDQSIRVLDSTGQAIENYDLNRVDKLLLKENYAFPDATLGDVKKELGGTMQKNFISVEIGGRQHRFDFIIDSFYGMKQLEKLIENWTQRPFPIERV